MYPNDEQELDRLDMQHHIFKLVWDGRLFFSPLHRPRHILDIGTGSGIWAMEMGKPLILPFTYLDIPLPLYMQRPSFQIPKSPEQISLRFNQQKFPRMSTS